MTRSSDQLILIRKRITLPEQVESSTRSVSSKLTHEWLEEAKQMVALSPSRDCDSLSRLVVSPRFATTQGSLSTSSLDKRDFWSARSLKREEEVERMLLLLKLSFRS
ncbi:uncharacterized protein Fot_04286 [Forsythia ovata]|uniref:Uncharacterized protein n=1 Tax=Forsythia ovata TaxID=205694 RepID=A0ABD1XCL8_9LAMI